ncbi:MAG: sigma-54-dependent Fis family transcriptional regulator [Acidimicrobiia bacterium]|nr:sigma-54-dependent Fis family transcriptional regulator [Acidimicrobiia bacterium]
MIVGEMREVMRTVRRAATTSAIILITGESGTGKEIVARAVHRFSKGPSWPFVPFNCTAVPRDLLESHLFGHRRGAFTGAERDHPGVVRTAKDGTLFLDEIGELSLELQPKLLRFLESFEITPLGESEPVHVNTRVVAATNANLETLVQQGKFRSDLFYRLRVVPIHVPALRDRRDEIPSLARHFVAKAAAADGKGHLELAPDAIELMTLYAWPGNVRQLNNEIRRLVALADNDATLTAEMLSPEIRRRRIIGATDDDAMTISFDGTLGAATARLERQMIGAALRKHSGRLDDTAKALGLSRKGLYLKRLRFGL